MKKLILILGFVLTSMTAKSEVESVNCFGLTESSRICTTDFSPVKCSYGDVSVLASNTCRAELQIIFELCIDAKTEFVEFNRSQAECAPL